MQKTSSLRGKEEMANASSLGVWVLDVARLRFKPGQTQNTCRSSPGPVPTSPHAPPSAAPTPPGNTQATEASLPTARSTPAPESGGRRTAPTGSVASLLFLQPRLVPPTSGHTGVTGQSWVMTPDVLPRGATHALPQGNGGSSGQSPGGVQPTVPRGRRRQAARNTGARRKSGTLGRKPATSTGLRRAPRRGRAGPRPPARDPPGRGLAPRLHSPPPRQAPPDQARARRLHVSAEHPHRLLVHL